MERTSAKAESGTTSSATQRLIRATTAGMLSNRDFEELASLIARLAHHGVPDHGDSAVPFYAHPKRVALAVKARGGNRVAVAAAYLHDVVEDTDITLDHLDMIFRMYFSGKGDWEDRQDLILSLECLTHRPHEPRSEYHARAKSRPTSLLVKDEDTKDNSDEDRLALLPPDDQHRLRRKYIKARRELGLT